VSDNGPGSADIDGGSGLIGVKDRVGALGGRVWERSASDVGTRAELPLSLPTTSR
jgi:signal transduction histidine kinase